jgi:2-aminoadipate transaminase
MLSVLEEHLPEGFTFSRPEGGMFIWAEGPEGMDLEKTYWKAVERNVAYVPGKYFFTEPGEGAATMRLNFTMADVPGIKKAVKTLGSVLGDLEI